ncbi:MAG: glycosyltransferase, partial [Candidatus Syntropharchaeales archaeon]
MAFSREAVRTACIIPAINEEATLAEVLSEVMGYVDHVILVDDGSTDRTPLIAKEMGVNVL